MLGVPPERGRKEVRQHRGPDSGTVHPPRRPRKTRRPRPRRRRRRGGVSRGRAGGRRQARGGPARVEARAGTRGGDGRSGRSGGGAGELGYVLLGGWSLGLALQAGATIALTLYFWEEEDQHPLGAPPETREPPRCSFTVLLPARHEEAVIQDTIQRVVELDYPPELVQVLVVIEAGDAGTIGKVNETLNRLRRRGVAHVRLLTFAGQPINKPRGLNVGLAEATGDVVTIFDAEDEPHPEILQV